jgi:outer membrane lipoprotein SlyB
VNTVKTTRTLTLAAAVSALALATGCASNAPSAVPVAPVTQSPAMYQSTQYGQVRAINVVQAQSGHAGAAGAVLGAVAGGALGNMVGGGNGRTAATVGGAVLGGVAGHRIAENRAGGTDVYRVDVQFDDGHTQSFDFQQLNGLQVGDRVKLQDGQIYRM